MDCDKKGILRERFSSVSLVLSGDFYYKSEWKGDCQEADCERNQCKRCDDDSEGKPSQRGLSFGEEESGKVGYWSASDKLSETFERAEGKAEILSNGKFFIFFKPVLQS